MNAPGRTLEPSAVVSEPVRSAWPRFDEDEIEAVEKVLRSGRVNGLVHGEMTEALAREFALYCGSEFGFCVANGTLGLEVAMRALGIGNGDEVIVPARSFYASASAVMAVGAVPAFADVDPVSQNLDPASVRRLVGPNTKAIIAVHLAGLPCDMASIGEIADEFGLYVIEDCAQAHGASIDGRRVGSFGDAASFSFCSDKIMSTGGEGGLVLFRDREPYQIGRSYKDHGKNFDRLADGKGRPGQFRYVHDSLGSNYRLTEMQAAIGRRQLTKLPIWLEARRRNAAALDAELKGHPALFVAEHAHGVVHARYKYYLQLQAPSNEPVEDFRSRIIEKLVAERVPVGTGSCPDMSIEQGFAGVSVRRDGSLKAAHDLGKRSLMFPVDHTLNADDMRVMASALLRTLESAR